MKKESTAPAPPSNPAERRLKYVGPEYDIGIRFPGEDFERRPGHMSQSEIADFLRLWPDYADWFVEE